MARGRRIGAKQLKAIPPGVLSERTKQVLEAIEHARRLSPEVVRFWRDIMRNQVEGIERMPMGFRLDASDRLREAAVLAPKTEAGDGVERQHFVIRCPSVMTDSEEWSRKHQATLELEAISVPPSAEPYVPPPDPPPIPRPEGRPVPGSGTGPYVQGHVTQPSPYNDMTDPQPFRETVPFHNNLPPAKIMADVDPRDPRWRPPGWNELTGEAPAAAQDGSFVDYAANGEAHDRFRVRLAENLNAHWQPGDPHYSAGPRNIKLAR
jgi:hypothetical protein